MNSTINIFKHEYKEYENLKYNEIQIDNCITNIKIHLIEDIYDKIFLDEIIIIPLEKKNNDFYIEYYKDNYDASFFNKYFCNIYLINLESRKDRLLNMLALINKYNLKIEIIKAINGKEEPYLSEYYEKEINLKKGEYGYLLTIQKILEDAKNNNYKKILILDDDIYISKYFYNFEYYTKYLCKDWDFLYLGSSQHYWKEDYNIKYTNYKFLYHPLRSSGSFSLGIDHKVFDELLNNIKKYDSPFDSNPIHDIINKNYKKSFAIYPNLFIANVENSDIRDSRDIIQFSKKVKWDLKQYDMVYSYKRILIILIINDIKKLLYTIFSIKRQSYKYYNLLIYSDIISDRIKNQINTILDNTNIFYFEISKYRIQDIIKKSDEDLITIINGGDVMLDNRLLHQVIPFYFKSIIATKCESNSLPWYEYIYDSQFLKNKIKLTYNIDYYKYLDAKDVFNVKEKLYIT